MKIQDISPVLHNLVYFQYESGERSYPKITSYKSQYAYHVLLISKGRLDVFVGDRLEHVKAGDAVYLLPGEVYRLMPCNEDFSLYNLFFDFCNDRIPTEPKYGACVLMQSFDTSLCPSPICFEDATVLNQSGVWKNLASEKLLYALLSKSRADATYAFHARAALFSLISELLLAKEEHPQKRSQAKEILAYIQANPEKDLSGLALSGRFSYHKNHVNKLVKQETGLSLCEYVRHVKIEYAKTLLAEELYPLTELAMRLGYYDYSHFYKAFCKELGLSPTEYTNGRAQKASAKSNQKL